MNITYIIFFLVILFFIFEARKPRLLAVDEAQKKNSPKAEPEDTTGFARGSS